MKYIRQRHNDDCGIASLAMVAGISYRKAYKLLRPMGNRVWCLGTWDEEICGAMRELGIDYELTYDKSFFKLGRPAIVAIDVGESGFTHAVAYDPKTGSIMDPGIMYMTGYSLSYCKRKFLSAIVNHGNN
jgi:ABC-type bacteriocin/lantibiotic exporter with double-glycine peptidase domain